MQKATIIAAVVALLLACGLYVQTGRLHTAQSEVTTLKGLRASDERARLALSQSLAVERKRHQEASKALAAALKENPDYANRPIPDDVAAALRM